ncbi:MAG: ABC transporter ATP-binding protein [Thermodesulfobacteriota bacterium]
MLLEARALTRSYPVDGRELTILDRVDLLVHPAEFVVVAGQSGSGKTTLLTLLSGLDRPSSGQVFFDGVDITDFDEDRLAPLRNRSFGFVFQAFHLVPSLTAMENVVFPAELAGERDAGRRGELLLRAVGLWERRDHFPSQLSGGEKQRAAICRALINRPRVVFADEPTGNLDSINGGAVLELLLTLRAEQGSALVLVTHNEEIAARADRIVTLRDGRIVADERN